MHISCYLFLVANNKRHLIMLPHTVKLNLMVSTTHFIAKLTVNVNATVVLEETPPSLL